MNRPADTALPPPPSVDPSGVLPQASTAFGPYAPTFAQAGALSDISPWLLWGPYMSERQWGTVREDMSLDGDAWKCVTHDLSRSVAYRWGEDGIGGLSDERQRLCLSLALWNGRDPILKERLFGLSNTEGNHGEDVKEEYHYLDNTPDHRWMRMVYRYPQAAFPYADLVTENARRGRTDAEYELADTGVLHDRRYFDVEIDVAKADVDDLLVRYTAHNRADADAELHLLPTLWLRRVVDAGEDVDDVTDPTQRSSIWAEGSGVIARRAGLGRYRCDVDAGQGAAVEWLFTDNLSNPRRAPVQAAQEAAARTAALQAGAMGSSSVPAHFKDGIGDRVVGGHLDAVRSDAHGTKAAAWVRLTVPANGYASVRVRLRAVRDEVAGADIDASIVDRPSTADEAWLPHDPFADFDVVMVEQQAAADAFYAARQDASTSVAERAVQRQAWAGLLWNKQFYEYDVSRWIDGDDGDRAALARSPSTRNRSWRHVRAHDVILMPDKWEYPWFAAWDLAFHCIAVAPIDPQLAKRQLTLLLHDRYMHPSGQLPAYEWNFSDVNPPVQAIAAWKIYQVDAAITGAPDVDFLRHVLHRLMLNFTWWVNRQDDSGNNIFEGGFLGLDNVGVFDRSIPLPGGTRLEQTDSTSWMAMYALNLMRIAMEIALHDPVYEDLAIKFAEHFFYIAGAMANMGNVEGAGLWDDVDGFYYDMLQMPDGSSHRLKLRTITGLIPLFAVEVLDGSVLSKLARLSRHLRVFLKGRPDLASLVSHWEVASAPGAARGASVNLFSLLRGHRMKLLLSRMLDEREFLSPHGIRSVSKSYDEYAFDYWIGSENYALRYAPAESDTNAFGGNSNWRGPVWMPLNYLIVESLRRFHTYYGDEFKVECPTGSGTYLTID
ncbi:MAG: Glucosidase, partial [Rhizobacter sp.]|nr:Glucosidase [Rhizobacter sp.]